MSHPLESMIRLFVPLLIIAPLGVWKLIEILIWIGGRLLG